MPKPRQQPRIIAANAERAVAQQARLATQLRANLARRKAQARARDADDANPGDDSANDESAS